MLKFLLKPSQTTFEKVSNVALAFIFLIVWTIGVLYFYKYLFATESISMPFQTRPGWQEFGFTFYKHPFLIDLFFGVIMAPLWEELVFRKFPLTLVKASEKQDLIIPAVLFTSVIFGLLHDGLPSILIQGVAGVVMSMLYIKNNWSYWSSVALHASWNLALTLGIVNLLN